MNLPTLTQYTNRNDASIAVGMSRPLRLDLNCIEKFNIQNLGEEKHTYNRNLSHWERGVVVIFGVGMEGVGSREGGEVNSLGRGGTGSLGVGFNQFPWDTGYQGVGRYRATKG